MERSELRAVMTADIEGFSSWMQADQEAVVRVLVDSYYAVVARAVGAEGGELFRKEGDAVWCSFPSAAAAVKAGAAIQAELSARAGPAAPDPAGGGRGMRLRMGIHLGEVVVTDAGDVLGHVLSVAKRLETACEPGALLVSDAIHAQLSGKKLGLAFEDAREVDLKGIGVQRAWLGRLVPEAPGEGRAGPGREPAARTGPRLVVAVSVPGEGGAEADPGVVRALLRHAALLGAPVLELGDDALVALAEPAASLAGLLADPDLARARIGLAIGDVVEHRDEQGRLDGAVGAPVEEAVAAVRDEGDEAGLRLAVGRAAEVVAGAGKALFEPAGPPLRARGSPVHRLYPPALGAARLSASHRVRRATGLGRDGEPRDLAVGVRPKDPAAPPGLAMSLPPGPAPSLFELHLSRAGAALPAPALRAFPELARASAAALEADPDLGLAAALAWLAAADERSVPAGTLALGALGPDGKIRLASPETLAPRLEGLAAGRFRTLLVPPGLPGAIPEGLARVEVGDLAGLRDWLAGSRSEERVRALAGAGGELVALLAGPAGGAAEAAALARALVAGTDVDPTEGEPARLAEEVEGILGRDAVRERFEGWARGLAPSPVLEALRGLAPRVVLTLFPDPRLPDALCLAGLPGRADLALSEADAERVLDGLGALPAEVIGELASRPLVVLGAAAGSEGLRAAMRRLRQVAPAAEGTRTFILVPTAGEAEVRWWERRGAELLVGDPAATLGAALARRAGPDARGGAGAVGTRPRRVPERPYKFLDSFRAQDRAIFFGRDREAGEILRRVLAHPLTVVYGRSGAGKTSLIGAGLVASLPRPRNLCLVLRALTEPCALVRSALAPLDREGGAGHLHEIAGRVAGRLSGRLVLVLDQFEEFFVRLPASARTPFVRELAELVRRRIERVHVVVSLREDFLAEMEEFEGELPTVLDSRFRLGLLGPNQARRAIVGPAEVFGASLDEDLVACLLEELSQDGIDPPQLQIVLDRLWTEVRAARPGGPLVLALDDYRRLGGVRKILVGYLQDSLADLIPTLGDLPKKALKAMVTGRGTKAVVAAAEVAERMGEPVDRAEAVLRALVGCRLVRSLAGEEDQLYEMAHEYLIQEVLGWASDAELSLRHARMVLRSEIESWERLGSLMGPDRLAVLEREAGRLDPVAEERALLVRAAAVHGTPIGPWLTGPRGEAEAVPVLAGLLGEPGLPGIVKRRVIAALFPRVAGDRAREAVLGAMEAVGNPTLLASLRPVAAGRETLLGELEGRMLQRFFGPARMVEVPAGPALVGSTPESKRARLEALAERPDLHERILGERNLGPVGVGRFWIDRLLVTHDDFAEFRPEHAHRYAPGEGGHPAVYVSWHDAVAYARWLGKELATEEEWEKAARGEDGRLYPWGNVFDATRLNSAESGLRRTTPVGSYPTGASPYGCLDMAGNVWEWTASAWASGSPFKTQKGGSTVNREPHQQASARFEGFPDFILQWVGFRGVVRRHPLDKT